MTRAHLMAWSCVLLGKGALTLAALRLLGLADPWPAAPLWPTGLALVAIGVALLWRRDPA
ncbi:MAG: hypothetical protein V4704_06495 [Pseudomonadota bacterium]